jgi:hypothetical protein
VLLNAKVTTEGYRGEGEGEIAAEDEPRLCSRPAAGNAAFRAADPRLAADHATGGRWAQAGGLVRVSAEHHCH